MKREISGIRGSRKTRLLAQLLLGVGGLATLALVCALGMMLASGLRDGGDQVGLMAIEPSHSVDYEAPIAPSRKAPADGLLVKEVTMLSPVPAVISEQVIPQPAEAVPTQSVTFDGRPLRQVQTVRMLTTAYSPDNRSCGIWADGITASGYSVWTNGMKLVAADTKVLPFGSIVSIPGYNGGRPVPVLDRGGRIKGNRLDLLYPTHERALQWGAQRLDVIVWEYADE